MAVRVDRGARGRGKESRTAVQVCHAGCARLEAAVHRMCEYGPPRVCCAHMPKMWMRLLQRLWASAARMHRRRGMHTGLRDSGSAGCSHSCHIAATRFPRGPPRKHTERSQAEGREQEFRATRYATTFPGTARARICSRFRRATQRSVGSSEASRRQPDASGRRTTSIEADGARSDSGQASAEANEIDPAAEQQL